MNKNRAIKNKKTTKSSKKKIDGSNKGHFLVFNSKKVTTLEEKYYMKQNYDFEKYQFVLPLKEDTSI